MTSRRNTENDFHVRPARAEDGAALADLHRAAILATSDDFYSAEERHSWASGLRADGYARSMSDGELIEVAAPKDTDMPIAFCGRRETGVVGLYVHPDHQQRGIGTLLLKRAEAALAEQGARLLTVEASLPAARFYERHGYTPVETFSHKTRGGLDLMSVRMTKTIP